MQSEDTWMELHVLHRHGWSIAGLAREFGLNWRTAKRYATAHEPPRYRPRVRPAELSGAQLAHIVRRLTACPDLRATVLLRELRDDYAYTGSYTSLRRRVVELRPRDEAEPEVRFETGPGIQTQGDWTDFGVWPLGDGTVELFAFVAILGCSRMVAVRFATDKTRPTTLEQATPEAVRVGGAALGVEADPERVVATGVRHGGLGGVEEAGHVTADVGQGPGRTDREPVAHGVDGRVGDVARAPVDPGDQVGPRRFRR